MTFRKAMLTTLKRFMILIVSLLGFSLFVAVLTILFYFIPRFLWFFNLFSFWIYAFGLYSFLVSLLVWVEPYFSDDEKYERPHSL